MYSFFERRICFNLFVVDIKVKEPDFEAMCRGSTKFLPPRFMSVNTALEQLLEIEESRGENGNLF